MSARSLLVVPPFIKYTSGPLLGPSLLQSAARNAGHLCDVLDLNAMYLSLRAKKRHQHGPFIGDHDKLSSSLTTIENEFYKKITVPGIDDMSRIKFGFLSHSQIRDAASRLVSGTYGAWARNEMLAHTADPQIIGISLLHSGQVIPATAISMLARQLFPTASVIWGGPHISGLGKSTIERDLSSRSFAADGFVVGHAEQTFVQLLDRAASSPSVKLDHNDSLPMVVDGFRGVTALSPTFENLDLYDRPLTLPAQSTLGCAYGKCAYCTYPAIEPRPAKLELQASVGSVVTKASAIGASISIKDSLCTPLRLQEIGECIQGQVRWSATTKLNARLDQKLLQHFSETGLSTLEVGLESLLDETQRRIGKVQSEELFLAFVNDIAQTPDLSLVVNYILNFPWEDHSIAYQKFEHVQSILENTIGKERSMIELNSFELERMAPMARFPELYDIRRTKSWPWASVLEYD